MTGNANHTHTRAHAVEAALRAAARIVAGMAALALVCQAGACGGRSSMDDDPTADGTRIASSMQDYADQLLREYKGKIAPEQRAVLRKAGQTGSISAGQYKAAWDAYRTCLTDAGITPHPTKTLSNGLIQEEAVVEGEANDNEANDDVTFTACSERYRDPIEKFYEAQVGNPNLYADHSTGAVDCLKRAGLVPKSYTVRDYQNDQQAEMHHEPGEKPDTAYDSDDPAVIACRAANGVVSLDLDGLNVG